MSYVNCGDEVKCLEDHMIRRPNGEKMLTTSKYDNNSIGTYYYASTRERH